MLLSCLYHEHDKLKRQFIFQQHIVFKRKKNEIGDLIIWQIKNEKRTTNDNNYSRSMSTVYFYQCIRNEIDPE